MEGNKNLTISSEDHIVWFKVKAAFHVPNENSSCSSEQIKPFAFLYIKSISCLKQHIRKTATPAIYNKLGPDTYYVQQE